MTEYKRIEFKLDAGSDAGIIKGYGSVFGNVDSHGDVIEKGAFKESLREWETKGKFAPMLLQHGGGMFGGTTMDGVPIGVWDSMEENSKGLLVKGHLLAMDTPDVTRIYEALKAGALDGLSIGYMVREFTQGTKAGEPRRTITNIDLWELSVVTFPSNDRARVSGVKAKIQELETLADAEKILRDAGFSKSASRELVSRVKTIARRDADGDQIATVLASLKNANRHFQS